MKFGMKFAEELHAVGLKITKPRLAVLNCFSKDCEPQSAETVTQTLSRKGIDMVTVYRTLAAFEKAGILKRVDLRKGSVFYERAGHHHHHVVCTGCGRTEQFEGCNVSAVGKSVLRMSKHFASIREHSLEFFGMCKKCAAV
jgi:Fur family ferric uptake transcriptional regulator